MTLSAEEFLRRFLQHVLPSGFQKVRHYGFAGANQGNVYEHVRWLVTLTMGLMYSLLPPASASQPPLQVRCAECGGLMFILAYDPELTYFDTS